MQSMAIIRFYFMEKFVSKFNSINSILLNKIKYIKIEIP